MCNMQGLDGIIVRKENITDDRRVSGVDYKVDISRKRGLFANKFIFALQNILDLRS